MNSSHHARGQGVTDGGFFIGVEPLEQFVVKHEGRWQVSQRAQLSDGGVIELTNANAEWTEPAFNWSGSCAPCHATGFVVATNKWESLSVSCQACHGDAAGHRAWLAGGKKSDVLARGFARSLRESRTRFALPAPDASIAKATSTPNEVDVDTCGGCHSRRRALTDDGALTGNYFDRFEPALMEPGLYGENGEALDEVFELGSFLMSPMYAAGVRCTNCHDPHSGGLRAEGDALCAQCHRLEAFTPHARGQQCISCHMPSKTFLAVNERRDHFFHGATLKPSSFRRAAELATTTDPRVLNEAMASPDDWLRYGAATALRELPRYDRKLGQPLLSDARRAIRVRAARAMVGIAEIPPRVRAELDEAERANAFRGEAWLNLGMAALLTGDRGQAETHFRRGLEVEPRFGPLLINLADLLRETKRDGEARLLLERAVKSPHPAWNTSLHYALGLARWRARDREGALAAFSIAKGDGNPLHVNAFNLAQQEIASEMPAKIPPK
ncbi:MAG: hypothetical protein JNM17_36275 [Archangium sp.]|nr:hypothetical protein [Archangium sp.]